MMAELNFSKSFWHSDRTWEQRIVYESDTQLINASEKDAKIELTVAGKNSAAVKSKRPIRLVSTTTVSGAAGPWLSIADARALIDALLEAINIAQENGVTEYEVGDE